MLGVLRRSRLLAFALLLATPALGGAWLQLAHPCPVDAPWAAEHGAGHGPEHGETHDVEGCHCVGSCAAGAVAALGARALAPVSAAPLPSIGPRLTAAVHAPSLRPADRLPPATAPPLA